MSQQRWWQRLRQSSAYPAQIQGQKVIAGGDLASGGSVLGTRSHMYLPREDAEYQAVAWQDIDHARWESPELFITFTGGVQARLKLVGPDERFARLLRERVQASIVARREVPLEVPGYENEKVVLHAVARKDFLTDNITWRIQNLTGAESTNPQVQQVITQQLTQLAQDVRITSERPSL